MSALVDGELATLLRAFRMHAGVGDSPPTPVSIKVTRRSRFTNLAIAVSGQTLTLDEPADFGGSGQSPDPAEYLLAAVGASLSVTLTAHAAMRGLAVERLSVDLRSRIDGRSFFEPRTWTRAGLLETSINVDLAGPMSKAEARSLMAETARASPVFQSLRRRPRVNLIFERTR